MRWIGRVLLWSIPLALIAFGVFWPLIFTDDGKPRVFCIGSRVPEGSNG
jgi:hypothetical protein